ncbi:F-box only protein 43 [Pseudorasbora parva]|uniref:F-box only protein 43 n=1 Tax=Pseudorasbora parva TaxID=51549 RepID=UPI00351F379F
MNMEGARVNVRMDRLYTPRTERHPSGTKTTVLLHKRDSAKEPKKEPAVPPAWCETPKLSRKDASLRRRLLKSLSSSDGSKNEFNTPGETTGDHLSFDSPDMSPAGPLSYSTLKTDDFLFSCRKRRLMFSQAVTSTLETGRCDVSPTEPDLDDSIIAGLHTHLLDDNFRSPVRAEKPVLDALTPAMEDSGFSSLGLDKSSDSSVDHDGSFQELVMPSGRSKRRSRLERQRRLSTLRESGSQSEDGPKGARTDPQKDEVFLDTTPLSSAMLKMQDLSLTPALQAVFAISLRSSGLDGPVRTSLPLSGLIGRKMGLDRVDIISELRMRNMRHVLAAILSLLSAADIYRFGQVCEDWNDAITENKKAAHRRRSHIRELKMAVEGAKPAFVPDGDTRSALASRSALGSVQAQARTPHTHSACTPTHTQHCSSKRMQFLQVAETLFSDEFLKPCPRCEHPARCHSLRGEGVCSWSHCGFRFCSACLCAFHGSRDCQHLSSKRRSRRDVLPGSAQSKRNIRRL